MNRYNHHDKVSIGYAEDENGVRYYIKQVETGIEYEEAVDVYPCRFTYVITNKKVQVDDVNS